MGLVADKSGFTLAAGAFTAIVTTLPAVAGRLAGLFEAGSGDTFEAFNALAARALAAIVATLDSVTDRNAPAQSLKTLKAIFALATGTIAAIVATFHPIAISGTFDTDSFRTDIAIAALPTRTIAAITTAFAPIAVGNAVADSVAAGKAILALSA